jgi:hypothetical protein
MNHSEMRPMQKDKLLFSNPKMSNIYQQLVNEEDARV